MVISFVALFVAHLATGHGVANITLLPIESGARSLDGSQYGFYFIRSPSRTSTRWTISIEGEGYMLYNITIGCARTHARTHARRIYVLT